MTALQPRSRRDAWRPWAVGTLLIVPLLNFLMIAIDWQLRDPANVRLGGIPNELSAMFGYPLVALFALAVFLLSPRRWTVLWRTLLAVGAGAVAFLFMGACWWLYIIGNAIDTI